MVKSRSGSIAMSWTAPEQQDCPYRVPMKISGLAFATPGMRDTCSKPSSRKKKLVGWPVRRMLSPAAEYLLRDYHDISTHPVDPVVEALLRTVHQVLGGKKGSCNNGKC